MSKAERYRMTSTRRMLEYALAYCEGNYPGADKIQVILTEASGYADIIRPEYTKDNMNIDNIYDLFDFYRTPNKIELCGDVPLNTLFIKCPIGFIESKMKYLTEYDLIANDDTHDTQYIKLAFNELYYYILIRCDTSYYFGKLDKALFDSIDTIDVILRYLVTNYKVFDYNKL